MIFSAGLMNSLLLVHRTSLTCFQLWNPILSFVMKGALRSGCLRVASLFSNANFHGK